jgi:transcriptional regulator of acetoin/glycerol metabolism
VEGLPGDVRELVTALGACDGNVVKAAKELGISRGRAYRLIAAAGIDVASFRKRGLFKS